MSEWKKRGSYMLDPGQRQEGSLHVEYGPAGAGMVAAAGTGLTAGLGFSLLLEGQVEACPLASCLL